MNNDFQTRTAYSSNSLDVTCGRARGLQDAHLWHLPPPPPFFVYFTDAPCVNKAAPYICFCFSPPRHPFNPSSSLLDQPTSSLGPVRRTGAPDWVMTDTPALRRPLVDLLCYWRPYVFKDEFLILLENQMSVWIQSRNLVPLPTCPLSYHCSLGTPGRDAFSF